MQQDASDVEVMLVFRQVVQLGVGGHGPIHDTKSMGALPGRPYDVKGIGWQQEGWRMGPGSSRGVGGHRFWLPWVAANHLYGITGLEEYDPALFKKLSTKPTAAANMPAVNK